MAESTTEPTNTNPAPTESGGNTETGIHFGDKPAKDTIGLDSISDIIVNGVTEEDLKNYEKKFAERNPEEYRELNEGNPAQEPAPAEETKASEPEDKPTEEAPKTEETATETPPAEEEERLLNDPLPLDKGDEAPAKSEPVRGSVPYSRFKKVVSDLKTRDAELASLRAQNEQLQKQQEQSRGPIDLSAITPDTKDREGKPLFSTAGEYHQFVAEASRHNQALQQLQDRQQQLEERQLQVIGNAYEAQIDAYAEEKPRIREALDYVNANCSGIDPQVRLAIVKDPMAAPLTWHLATKAGALRALEGDPYMALLTLGEMKAEIKRMAETPKKVPSVVVKEGPKSAPVAKPATEVVAHPLRSSAPTPERLPRGFAYAKLREQGYHPEQIMNGDYRREA